MIMSVRERLREFLKREKNNMMVIFVSMNAEITSATQRMNVYAQKCYIHQ